MHELGLVMALIEQVQDVVKREQASRVQLVTIRVGRWSGVDRESLAFCYPLATRDTVAAASRLIILDDPGTLHCAACAAVSPATVGMACPACGSHETRITGGDALILQSLEVDTW